MKINVYAGTTEQLLWGAEVVSEGEALSPQEISL